MRDRVAGGEPKRVHCFVSAWHRKADEPQRLELAQHNLKVFSITSEKNAEHCITWINEQVALKRHVVIHLDECDHGSGSRQKLGLVWREIRENKKITSVLYSATPEEVLYSEEIDNDYRDLVNTMVDTGCKLEYKPVYYNPDVSTTSGYCGPATFLDNDLVHNATPFFRSTALTSQAKAIVAKLRDDMRTNPKRNIVVLRLSYSIQGAGKKNLKENKAIYQFLANLSAFEELRGFLVLVDKGEDFGATPPSVLAERIQWSNRVYWDLKAASVPILIVIDQTTTRSTEWKCHDRVHTVHDFRNVVQFSTLSQAQERVNHYADTYSGFQPINVYGSLKTFQLSAGRIDYATFLTNEWFKRKIDRRRTGHEELWLVKNSTTNAPHPDCAPTGISQEAADTILENCGCASDPGLSSRVRGSVKSVAKVRSSFHPCDPETFDAIKTSRPFIEQAGEDYNPRNHPFGRQNEDGQYLGFLREWRVFNFSEIEASAWGFNASTNAPRMTVCYRDGIIGIALRTLIGFEPEDTLTAYRTMYHV